MNNFIDQILERANIVDVIGKYVRLHKSGANYFGLCPFHADNRPTNFCVSPAKKIFKCFVCNVSGNAITFIQKYKKVSYAEAVKEVAKLAGFSDEEINAYFSKTNKNYNPETWRLFSLNSEANDIFKALLFNEENKQYLDYITNRKLSLDTIKKFDIGFCGKGDAKQIVFDLLTNKEVNPSAKWNEDDLLKTSLININDKTLEINDYFFNRITFPIKDKNGFITGFIARDIAKDTKLKYLTSRETALFSKSNTLYNFDKVYAEHPNTLIVLEGNVDLMSLYEAGIDEKQYGAVALMGTALTTQHINMLRNVGFIKNILLWFDNDDAGKQSTITNGKRLLEAGFNVLVVNNKTKHKDVNDILVNEGKQAVLDLVVDKQKPDFLTYYITKILENVSSTNVTSVVNDLLSLIKTYGSSLMNEKYCSLIANATNLSIEDIKNTLINAQTKRFGPQQARNPQKQAHVFANPIIKNLINSYVELLNVLIANPDLTEGAYTGITYKNFDIVEVKDLIYIIKNFALESFDPSNILEGEEKVVDDLYANKKIGKWAYEVVKDIIANFKYNYKDANIYVIATKGKRKTLVDHINNYCAEILLAKAKHQLTHCQLTEEEKTKLQARMAELSQKIVEFKKHKKTKYHI